MSIFIDESVKPKPLKWDTDLDLAHNLKRTSLLFFDLLLRDKIVEDKSEYAELAKKFVSKAYDLIEHYEVKINAIRAKRFYATPKKLSKHDFIQQCIAIIKKDHDFKDTLDVLGINEQQLATEHVLVRCMREFNFSIDITVNVNFENFEVQKMIETEIGIFLLCEAYGDWEHPVYFYAYLSEQDSGKFFTYVPQAGNFWDVKKRRAFQNEGTPRHESQYDKKAMLEDMLAFFGARSNDKQ